MRRFAHALALILAWAIATPAALAADTAERAVEQQVGALARAAAPSIGGQPIAARELIVEFYRQRGFRPAWANPENVAALLQAIEESVLDGLRPSDFHQATVGRLAASTAFADAPPNLVAERDLLLTDALARLLYQLYYGKVDPRHLDPNWNFGRPAVASDILEIVGDSLERRDIAGVIERARLEHPTYRILRQGLARYRAIDAAGGWRSLPAGLTLKPGMSDPAVPILRERLMATGDLDQPPVGPANRFGEAEASGVRRFQARHGLAVDGIVGPATRAALNVPVRQRIDQLRANLERARWILRLAHDDVIEVDIAGFSVERIQNGRTVWQSRAIVGQPFRQTPVFADEIEYVVFNPTWTVPRTIVVEDILPKIRANPAYLAEQGFDVLDGLGRHVPLETAISAALAGDSFPWILVQRPGPLNALGQMKFMFPNRFAVYLHDTPSRGLFNAADRSFSSGCIRVQDARGLAELLLERNPGWDRARIEAVIASGETRTVFLQRRLPVRLLYRTADALPDGTILFRADLYDRDGPLLAALDQPFRPVFPAPAPTPTPVSLVVDPTRTDG
jgi:murein L,D-transpeptidase YcbB/YkuD